MTRNLYGAGTTDYAVSSTGAPVAGATLTVYTAPGGTLITDLLTVTDNLYTPGGAITSVTTTATGQYPFYGPDGENGTLYLQSIVAGVTYWYAVTPSNEGDSLQTALATIATLSAAVTTLSATVAGLGSSLPTGGTTAKYLRGDSTWQTLTADAVPDGTTNKAYTAAEKVKLASLTAIADINTLIDNRVSARMAALGILASRREAFGVWPNRPAYAGPVVEIGPDAAPSGGTTAGGTTGAVDGLDIQFFTP